MDILGLKQVAAALPAEMQAFANAMIISVTQLESKTAADVQTIADAVINGLKPMIKDAVDAVNTVTLTVNASVVEVTALARRLDGSTVRFALGPESSVTDDVPSVTVRG